MSNLPGSRFCGGCASWVLKGDQYEQTKKLLAEQDERIRALQMELRLATGLIEKMERDQDAMRLAVALAPGFAKGKSKAKAGMA